MRFISKILILATLLCIVSCSSNSEPASPVQTFKTYIKAAKQKDITTMKLLLSSDTIKMHEQEAKAQNVALDDIVKRETLLGEGQTTVEFRDEKIDGNKATLEVKNSYGSWETIPFVKENDEWKIDKKGYADQIMLDFEKSNQDLDNKINNGRQP